jgi:hypothetical protein
VKFGMFHALWILQSLSHILSHAEVGCITNTTHSWAAASLVVILFDGCCLCG